MIEYEKLSKLVLLSSSLLGKSMLTHRHEGQLGCENWRIFLLSGLFKVGWTRASRGFKDENIQRTEEMYVNKESQLWSTRRWEKLIQKVFGHKWSQSAAHMVPACVSCGACEIPVHQAPPRQDPAAQVTNPLLAAAERQFICGGRSPFHNHHFKKGKRIRRKTLEKEHSSKW